MINKVKRLLFILLCGSLFMQFTISEAGPSRKFFRKANKFFKKNVDDGKVDYRRLLKKSRKLNKLVVRIADFPVNSSRPKVKEAFYINAYHILLIKNIIDNYPVQFPLEHLGIFSQIQNKVGPDTLTLNEIEEQKLIGQFKDIRVVFVLSSAGIGSVPIPEKAFKPGKLNKQLRKSIEKTCNSFDYVRVMSKSKKILLAEAWRKSLEDFNKEELIIYLNRYREEPLPQGFSIDFYPANRKINSTN